LLYFVRFWCLTGYTVTEVVSVFVRFSCAAEHQHQ
jgi:hypothetical protein